jgi:hypothetical protein
MNELIRGYQSLFSNRHSAMNLETLEQLKAIIQIELLDELTHPRVRKNPQEKLEIAVARIDNSELISTVKQDLIKLYISVFENVNSK